MSAARFRVDYRIVAADRDEAMQRARAIALEQTVEIPDDIVPAGFVRDEVVGQIVSMVAHQDGGWIAAISYRCDCATAELPQLLNLVFGNTSLQRGVRVEALHLDESYASNWVGPRFGIAGLRRLLCRPTGALICSVIKPMGLPPDQLARMCHLMALGGVDVVKDDHGIANQCHAPFEPRVRACAEAVARANGETGGHSVFAANVTGPADSLLARARLAKQLGAGALMVLPGLLGFDALRLLADDTELGLPLLSHPALLGSHVVHGDAGFSHGVLLGQLQRLVGADVSIFPNVGGRFGFSADDCLAVARGCRAPSGAHAPIFPAPGGGMTLDRIPSMRTMYGDDVMLLLGGSLLRHGDAMSEAIRAIRRSLDVPYA